MSHPQDVRIKELEATLAEAEEMLAVFAMHGKALRNAGVHAGDERSRVGTSLVRARAFFLALEHTEDPRKAGQ